MSSEPEPKGPPAEGMEPKVEAPAPRRLHDLDALRAFAMLLGIGLHGVLSFTTFAPFGWAAVDRTEWSGFDTFFHAVHGFRMPLFFLLSGFFTAMLWRRRGLGGLLGHRSKRILLPLVLGSLLFVPAVNKASEEAGKTRGVRFARQVEEAMGGQPSEGEPADASVDDWWDDEGASEETGEQETGEESASARPRGRQEEGASAPAPDHADLFAATRAGDLEAVRALLAEGADTGARDDKLATALHYAAGLGHAQVASALLEAGTEVDIPAGDNTPPLVWAVLFGQVEVAGVLLEAGADPNIKNTDGSSAAIITAAPWSDLKGIVGFIAGYLGLEVDLERVGRDRKALPALLEEARGKARSKQEGSQEEGGSASAVDHADLFAATRAGDLEAVRALLAEGADTGARDDKLATALHYAAGLGHAQVASALLEAGTEVDIPAGDNTPPLVWAVLFGQVEVAGVLLEAGADPNIKNTDGSSAAIITAAPWSDLKGIVGFIAGYLGLEVDLDRVSRDREALPALLEEAGGKAPSKQEKELEELWGFLFFYPVFR